jgi:FkbH-like protein
LSPDGGFPLAVTARNALGSSPKPSSVDIFIHGTRLLGAKEGQLRIAVAGSATTDLIARAVAVSAAQEGIAPVVVQAPFGAWRQEALDANSALHRFAPDLVVLVTDWRDAVTDLPLNADAAAVDAAVAAKIAGLRRVWDALRAGVPARRIIQHLPAAPTPLLGGIAELRAPASARSQIAAIRAAMLQAGHDIAFLDTEGLTQDAAAWYGAKLPFAQADLPDYVARFRAVLRQVTGRAKKVLALDLDNTLWGGVIGDDGVEGLALGPDTPRGEAFAAFQSYAKALAARGVVLAVCSKNDPAIAETGFSHPHSVLARADFAAFACAWTDKAGSLRQIAKTLNLGLDSFVFADDNPAECALVRAELPEVMVVELGDDPARFIALLEEGAWFASQALSAEDLARGSAYQARAQAAAAEADAVDLDSFLDGLEMRGRVFRADGPALVRIAQLEGKTNQFNLTTRRHSEAAILAFAAREDALVLGATLADKFGDHGLVSSLVAVVEGDALVIDSWLMSCRVFSRTLEQFVMRAVLTEAAARGLRRIVGAYAPTAKNDVVADLYSRLGFTEIETGRMWERVVADPGVGELVTFIAEAPPARSLAVVENKTSVPHFA